MRADVADKGCTKPLQANSTKESNHKADSTQQVGSRSNSDTGAGVMVAAGAVDGVAATVPYVAGT